MMEPQLGNDRQKSGDQRKEEAGSDHGEAEADDDIAMLEKEVAKVVVPVDKTWDKESATDGPLPATTSMT
jgi:hypothetical protein